MTDNDREIQTRQERWRRFLDPADESAPPFMFLIRYQDDPLPRPPLWPDRHRERVEWAWQAEPDSKPVAAARAEVYESRAGTESSLMARSIFTSAAAESSDG